MRRNGRAKKRKTGAVRKTAKRAPKRTGAVDIDPMDDLRQRIDAIDQRLVRMLNQRASFAIDLGRIKKERGLAIYQPSREEEVIRNVRGGNGGPLHDEALQRLFERIIDESRSIERIIMVASDGQRSAETGPDEYEDPAD